MKLDKAIEILELDKKCEYEGPGKKLEEALQLGIEAIEREEWNRANDFVRVGCLPSETQK